MTVSKEKRLSYTEQAKQLVASLTLEEKVYLMSGQMDLQVVRAAITKQSGEHYNSYPYPAGGIPEKGIPAMLFCDGPRGVVCGTGKSTCFPVSMCRGATFDIALEAKIGRAVAREVQAYGGNLFAGVCINLPYNPGWGRSQETYGEESFHIGEMGAALTRGVQQEGVIACLKHLAFNQMEISRFKVNVTCAKRTEREVFLPHFKKCIEAGAGAVMSAYNLYNGVHCGHSHYLQNELLKQEWGFDGFVMSDFNWGVKDTVQAANGGMDIEMCCTKFFGEKLVEAVQAGLVAEATVNEAALRIVRTLIAFDAEMKPEPESVIGCDEHIALAKQAAREGIVLLQNKNNLLPLQKSKTKKLLLLGKLAKAKNIGDGGSSEVYSKYVVSPLQGLAAVNPDANIVYYDGSDIQHSCELAKQADAVVLVAGYNHADEGEFVAPNKNEAYTSAIGGDRTGGLGLHAQDVQLIQAIGAVNSRTAVVLIGGNTIMIEEWKHSVEAILMAFYPGMEGGTAIAEILYGDVNPSGKLPFVLPAKEEHLPQVKWDTDAQFYQYYHGYTKLEKEGLRPSLPFGFGLSYTSFAFCNAEFTAKNGYVCGKCMVKNIGERSGEEVVQLYVGFANSKINRPVKILRGFARVALQPGEEKAVEICCSTSELCWYNEETASMELEHMEYQVYIGNSADTTHLLQGTVTL